MGISVIIPVHNCAPWIEQSVESALQFDLVKEVIIIEDGSTDGSFSLISELASREHRVLVLHHPNNQNRGRSASRNLGARAATQPWIAFLDADDYFLSTRFAGIDWDSQADGYYGSIKSESEVGTAESGQITGLSQMIKPESLYLFLTEQSEEYFSIISLTVQRDKLLESGLFDLQLEVGEDTDLIWRLSKCYNLYPQKTSKKLAIRRVHQRNSHRETVNRAVFYFKWLKTPPYPLSKRAEKRLFYSYQRYKNGSWTSSKIYQRYRYLVWKLSGKRTI